MLAIQLTISKKTVNLGVVLCIFLSIVSTYATGYDVLKTDVNSSEDSTEFYAVIVTADSFQNYEPPMEMKYGKETAYEIYNTLLQSQNWKKDHIQLLVNQNATKNAINNSITCWLNQQADNNDVVLFYVVAHGGPLRLLDEKGSMVILPYDGNFSSGEGLITDTEFDVWFSHLTSDHIVFIVESCYAGGMKTVSQKGRVVITSSSKLFFSLAEEDEYLKLGIFSYYMLQAMTPDGDVNKDGWVSAEEAFTFARWKTCFHALQYCLQKSKTDPYYLSLFLKGQIPQFPQIYDTDSEEIQLFHTLSTTRKNQVTYESFRTQPSFLKHQNEMLI